MIGFQQPSIGCKLFETDRKDLNKIHRSAHNVALRTYVEWTGGGLLSQILLKLFCSNVYVDSIWNIFGSTPVTMTMMMEMAPVNIRLLCKGKNPKTVRQATVQIIE